MITRLITKNISLDTSFVESQNFLAGSKMKDLSELCQRGLINVFITDITYNEILIRFQKRTKETADKLKKPVEEIKNSGKLLRNFIELQLYFSLPIIDVDALQIKFQANFDNWLKTNEIKIVPTEHITIKEVFQDYYTNKPPFKEGKKKHEFPDAFTLKALEDYFTKTSNKSYLLTLDNDIMVFESKNIIPIKDASELFDLVIRSEKGTTGTAITVIEKEIEASKGQIEEEAHDMIFSSIEDELNASYQVDTLEVDSVDNIVVDQVQMGKYSIVSLDLKNEEASIECDLSFSFKIVFTANDYSRAWYDKEDSRWYFVESRSYEFSDTYDVKLNMSATFNLFEEVADLELLNINEGKKLEIWDSFYSKRDKDN